MQRLAELRDDDSARREDFAEAVIVTLVVPEAVADLGCFAALVAELAVDGPVVVLAPSATIGDRVAGAAGSQWRILGTVELAAVDAACDGHGCEAAASGCGVGRVRWWLSYGLRIREMGILYRFLSASLSFTCQSMFADQ